MSKSRIHDGDDGVVYEGADKNDGGLSKNKPWSSLPVGAVKPVVPAIQMPVESRVRKVITCGEEPGPHVQED